jgi:hypothetical protein
MMDKFFKKASGVIVKFNKRVHDIKSLDDRFEKYDENDKKIKVEVKAKRLKNNYNQNAYEIDRSARH